MWRWASRTRLVVEEAVDVLESGWAHWLVAPRPRPIESNCLLSFMLILARHERVPARM